MIPSLSEFISLDLPAMLTATFAAITCALLGNFLVLRKLSLMGDAISHSVLPGIVIAFLLTGSRASFPVFLGAALAGLFTVGMVEIIRRFGRVESGAAMGVVFSILFALGVLLMEQAAARSVDLDADCLLHGQLETIFWNPPATLSSFLKPATLGLVPGELVAMTGAMILSMLFVWIFYKELRLVSFDSALATSLGYNATFLHFLLMFFVAIAVVASFKAVGSILVIGMLICPAASARLFTDSLRTQISLSILLATLAGVVGYLLGAFGPFLIGYNNSVSAAGMITVTSGAFLTYAILFAPQYGVAGRWFRRRFLNVQIRGEDILGLLYRIEELRRKNVIFTGEEIHNAFGKGPVSLIALRGLKRAGELIVGKNGFRLTDAGRRRAATLVRTHRLWESYLVDRLGLQPDHVHPGADRLEHFTDADLRKRLEERAGERELDPHGKPFPEE